MNYLEMFIKELNLVFTNTLESKDFCIVGFDINKIDINYEDTISLEKLVSCFNKLYLKFKEEYEALNEFKLGESIEILDFYKGSIDVNNYRNLIIYIDKPSICDYKRTFLNLFEKNNETYSYITNYMSPLDEKYYRKIIDLDSGIIKEYLNLFEKYQELFDLYAHLREQFVFGDGSNVLFSRIKGNLTKQLNFFQLDYGSECNFVTLFINLGNNFGIDYNSSQIILDNKKMEMDKNSIDKLFSDTYVHKSYLKRKRR